MSHPVGTTQVRAINISEVLRGIARRWKMLAAFTLGFALLGFLFITFTKPVYTSEARLLVEYQDSPYTRSNTVTQPLARQVGDREVRSQVEVLKSPDLALKVLRRLKLIGTPEFDALKRGVGIFGRLKIALGFAPDPRRQTPEQRALTTWNKRLKAYNIPLSKVLVIEYTSHDPRIAAAVANTLAKFYIEQTRKAQLDKTGEARGWLKAQIDKLRKKVVESEVAVERYRAQAGLYKGTKSSLKNQELSELSSQIIKAAAERSQAQARARAIREMLKTTGSVETSSEVLKSPLIQRLREQQVRLQRRLAELSTTYLDNHPKVRAVRRELRDLSRQIRSEARKIAASLEQQAKIAAAREASLRVAFAKLKAKVSDASVSEVRLRELERESKANRSLLESFLARYTDAASRNNDAAQPGMARIISSASVQSMPSFPKTGPVMILSILAGLVLGLGIAFIIEVMAASSRLSRQQAAAAPAETAVQPQAPAAQPAAGAPVAGAGGVSASEGISASVIAARAGIKPAETAPSTPVQPAAAQVKPVQAVPVQPAPVQPAVTQPAPAQPVTAQSTPVQTAAAQSQATNAPLATAAEIVEQTTVEKEQPFPVLPGLPDAMAAQPLALAPVADANGPYARALEPVAAWIMAQKTQDALLKTGLATVGGLMMDGAAAALALGRMLAMKGSRVIVVDTDMKTASLNAATGRDGGKGLSDLLKGQASFVDIIEKDGSSPAHLIHAGEMAAQAAGMTGSSMMSAVLGALAQSYDIVLLNEGDTAFPADRESSVLPLCDAAIVIAPEDSAGLSSSLCGALAKAGITKTACLRVAGATVAQEPPAQPQTEPQQPAPEQSTAAKDGPLTESALEEPPAPGIRAGGLF